MQGWVDNGFKKGSGGYRNWNNWDDGGDFTCLNNNWEWYINRSCSAIYIDHICYGFYHLYSGIAKNL